MKNKFHSRRATATPHLSFSRRRWRSLSPALPIIFATSPHICSWINQVEEIVKIFHLESEWISETLCCLISSFLRRLVLLIKKTRKDVSMFVQNGSGTQTISLIIFLFMPQSYFTAVPIYCDGKKAKEVQWQKIEFKLKENSAASIQLAPELRIQSFFPSFSQTHPWKVRKFMWEKESGRKRERARERNEIFGDCKAVLRENRNETDDWESLVRE